MATAPLFSERKAAESAAFLLFKAGGELPVIKLIKLLYLAERLALERYGEPLTGDRLVSMQHGPVLSITYNHLNGAIPSSPGGWDAWVADRAEHKVSLLDPSKIRRPELDLLGLSDTDLEVLDEIWTKFGHWDRWKLVDFTHEKCPEWEDPDGSSKPITYGRLFETLGYSNEQAQALIDRLSEQERINKAFT